MSAARAIRDDRSPQTIGNTQAASSRLIPPAAKQAGQAPP